LFSNPIGIKSFEDRLHKKPMFFNPYTFGGSFDLNQLKAYYKFNEASGDVLNKASSVGSTDAIASSDLTVTGATYQHTTGIPSSFTYGMSFDGVNDKAVAQSLASTWKFLSDQTDSTIVIWIKPTGTVVNGKAIMSTVDNSATNGFIFDFRTTGDLRFITEKATSPTGNVTWTAPNLSSGNWYMLVHRHDNSNNIFELFTDNIDHGNNSATVPAANTPDVTLEFMDTTYTGALDGVITECSIWNRLLTDAEISTLYNSGNGLEL